MGTHDGARLVVSSTDRIHERGRRNRVIRTAVRSGRFDVAGATIAEMSNHWQVGRCIEMLLEETGSLPVLEVALQKYLDLPRDSEGDWDTNSFATLSSNFIRVLWDRGLVGWVKKFYQVILSESPSRDELADLVCGFVAQACWSDHSTDFFIDPVKIGEMKFGWYGGYDRARLEAPRFESEAAFHTWKLRFILERHPIHRMSEDDTDWFLRTAEDLERTAGLLDEKTQLLRDRVRAQRRRLESDRLANSIASSAKYIAKLVNDTKASEDRVYLLANLRELVDDLAKV